MKVRVGWQYIDDDGNELLGAPLNITDIKPDKPAETKHLIDKCMDLLAVQITRSVLEYHKEEAKK